MNFQELREKMVNDQLVRRGITDQRVLRAMRTVPRENFVPQNLREQAYEDHPLPIGSGQTISQPYVVALMCQLLELKGHEKVLDIGTGSGYQAAVLSLLAQKLIGIEINQKLARKAGKILKELGYENIDLVTGNGRHGLKKEAPYNAIISAAASNEIPKNWIIQLKTDGRIVLPIKKRLGQELVRVSKKGEKLKEESFGSVVFVPLV